MMSSQHPIGGLSHLVEAATALTQLIDAPRSENVNVLGNGNKPRSIVSDDDDERRRFASKQNLRAPREIFPQRLMTILAESSLSDIVSWLPHGQSFVIIRPDVFSETVLPKYFPSNDSRSSTKYPSFTRKLNRWGFRQATRGPDTGAFHHPLFRRDQPNLCLEMVCQKSRKRPSGSTDKTKGASTTEEANKLSERSLANNTELRRTVSDGTSWTTLPLTTTKMTTTAATPQQRTLVNIQCNPSQPNPHSTTTITVTPPPPSPQNPIATTTISTHAAAAAPTSQSSSVTQFSPYIPTDPAMVAAALRERDEIEKMKVAKSMLYDAYLKALNSHV
mmetsp:Transcript_30039/g.42594  ORF Transcript_30039/g.42594 Transcript_30039/m.42594 type:complete len:333 (-) Transcript_30039:103-1101(-)